MGLRFWPSRMLSSTLCEGPKLAEGRRPMEEPVRWQSLFCMVSGTLAQQLVPLCNGVVCFGTPRSVPLVHWSFSRSCFSSGSRPRLARLAIGDPAVARLLVQPCRHDVLDGK
eukprot:4200444-Pyramimonas_sp.AAC.1